MKSIEWSPSLSISIKEIDDQHKGLIETINTLEAAARDPNRNKVCFEIVLKLKSYFNEHFTTEEKYMLQYNYPELLSHKQEHAEFIKNVLDFELACVEFYSPFTPMLDFLKEWLLKHVAGTDMKMGDFLKKKITPS
jgi:hemerythrin-like metal-binding protein